MRGRWRLAGILVGGGLILAAIGWLVAERITASRAATAAAETVAALQELMPPVFDTAPDGRAQPAMTAVELEGNSFCGLLEAPGYGVTLPLSARWEPEQVEAFPCRYTGSIHDGTLIVGGDGEQMAFLARIGNGERVTLTDMTGGRYTLRVTAVLRTRDVSTAHLRSREGALVLFARRPYSLDYTVVWCTFEQ